MALKPFATGGSFLGLPILAILTLLSANSAIAATVTVLDFEGYFDGPNQYQAGPLPGHQVVPGPYGDVAVSSFQFGGMALENRRDMTYDSWSGFALSNTTDSTTEGYTNQFSAYPGSGASGSASYAVAFGYHDLTDTLFGSAFDPSNSAHLQGLPSIYLESGWSVQQASVANTTYAYLSMFRGDGFGKQFTTADGDYFILSIYGIDALGGVLPDSIEHVLADFRTASDDEGYIQDDWQDVDFSSLSDARSLHFNLSSSDAGDYGMKTPAYFAIDNIRFSVTAVPEPGTWLALLSAGGAAGWRRWRNKNQRNLAASAGAS